MDGMEGSCWPRNRPRNSENVPATSPFQATMVSGSLAEMLRVKLLSRPHRVQASRMPSAPKEKPLRKLVNWELVDWGLRERKMLAMVMAMMAAKARRLI